jgi:hypothetical protein
LLLRPTGLRMGLQSAVPTIRAGRRHTAPRLRRTRGRGRGVVFVRQHRPVVAVPAQSPGDGSSRASSSRPSAPARRWLASSRDWRRPRGRSPPRSTGQGLIDGLTECLILPI